MSTFTLYASRRYDYNNIPVSGDILRGTASVVATCNNLAPSTEDAILQRILRVEVPSVNSVSKANFAYIDDLKYWYDITGYRILNKRIVEFSLEFNPFLSFGVFDSTDTTTVSSSAFNVYGTADRLTPEDADAVYNMLPESWTPAEPMKHVNPKLDQSNPGAGYPLLSGNYSMVAVTVDPASAKEANEVLVKYTGSNIDSYQVKPRAIGPSPTTVFKVYDPVKKTTITESFEGIGVYFYAFTIGNNTYNNTYLDYINSLGLNNAVIARWNVPAQYVTAPDFESSKSTGFISTLETDEKQRGSLQVGLSDLYSGDGASISNAKALYYYATLKVTGHSSGNSKQWRFIDVIPTHAVNAKASLELFINPAFNGKPYMLSHYYNFRDIEECGINPEYIVAGSTWISPASAVQGASGQTLNDFYASESLKSQRQGALINLAGGLLNTALTGNVAGLAGTAGNLISTSRNIEQTQNRRNIQDAVYTPVTYGSTDMSDMQEIVGNNFLIEMQGLSKNDLVSFDRFLTRYGYADNKQIRGLQDLQTTVKNNGAYFCYIRIPDAEAVITNSYNMQAKPLIENRLRNGVRIWKQWSDNAYNNNNKNGAISLN